MSTTTLYTASWLYTPGHPPIAGGALAVKDGHILETGTSRDLIRRYGQPTADYPGCVILPGFVNAHTHLELTHFPAWRLRSGMDYHPRRFVDWIVQMVKVRRGVSHTENLQSVKTGIAACLRAGTTSVGDIVTTPELLEGYIGSALGGRLYQELIGQDPALFEPRLNKALNAAHGITGTRQPGLSPMLPIP